MSTPAVSSFTGTVIDGVEHGSVVLTCEGGTYQIGAAFEHLIGHRVTVTGYVLTDVFTIAMQGDPLHVDSVEDHGTATPQAT